MTTDLELVRAEIADAIEVLEAASSDAFLTSVTAVAKSVVACLREGHKVLFFGNGGSAADADHFAAELLGRYRLDRRALPAISLTSNTSALTAIGNDMSFDEVFGRQIEALGQPGDVAVGISTSGLSRNVLDALRIAKAAGLVTVCMTGEARTEMVEVSNFAIQVPSKTTARIQEVHTTVAHAVCDIVEREFVESSG